jgi:hypothetical protein
VNLALTEEQQFVRQTFSTLFGKGADPARVRAAEPLGYDARLWAHVIATGAASPPFPSPSRPRPPACWPPAAHECFSTRHSREFVSCPSPLIRAPWTNSC